MKVIASWQYCLIIPFLFLALLVKCKYKSKMKKWKLGVVGGFGVNGWREEDETTNEGNIRLLSRGEAAKFSISYKLEYQCCCSGKDPEYSDPHLWLTFGELCGSCDWNSCVFIPPSPLPPEINWFEDPFEKFSPMMLIEVLSSTLPHYHWSFQNIHRYSFHNLQISSEKK